MQHFVALCRAQSLNQRDAAGPRAPLRALVMHLYNSDGPISARNGVHVTSYQVLQAGGAPGRVEKLEDAV